MHHHTLTFIQDLAIIMIIAGLVTILCHRLKQPTVLGYILAGVIIGPHTPPFSYISDPAIINTLAELGVIFLMFTLGLEFNIHKLHKVGKTALLTATLEIIFMGSLGYMLGILFGWNSINAIFLGALLSISSTTIIVKALDELGVKKERSSQIIFGILIVEDIFAILILALLSSVALSGTLAVNEVILTATKFTSFLVVSMLLGLLLVPRLLSYVAKYKSDEVLLVTVLGLCFGFCLLVVKFDYSMALGAFIIGAIIAESKQHVKIESLVNSLRTMFSAIFFVSVGLLFDPMIVGNYFFSILIIIVAVILGKVLSCTLGVLITGHDGKTSLRVGMGLAQIGEFSFIIASLGITLNVTSSYLYSIAVSISLITTMTTPYLIKYSDTFASKLSDVMPVNLAHTFKIYASWLQNIHPAKEQLILKSTINRNLAHAIVNLFIVIALFLCGAYIANTELGNSLIRLTNIHLQKSIIWALALALSLPFLLTAYLKIKALSKILAQLSLTKKASTKLTYQIRLIISEIIPLISLFLILALISLLSANILPSIEFLALILIIIGILVVFLFPWLMKLHEKLQLNLMESIKKDE